jgi:cytochrome b561
MDKPAMKFVQGYSRGQIWLHWVIAAMVTFTLLPVSRDGVLLRDSDGALGMPMTLHIGIGLLLGPLTLVRLLLRLKRGVPKSLALETVLLRGGGFAAHVAMYALILVLVASGACAWYLGSPVARQVHEVGRVLLTCIVGLHVAAALTHHFLLHDSALKRILVAEQTGRGPEPTGSRGRRRATRWNTPR